MYLPSGPYAKVFMEHTPIDYMRLLLRRLIDAYPEAHDRSREFPRPVAKYYRPFLRRSLIETQIVGLATGFKDQILAKFEDDPSSGFWTHAVAVCHKRVAITQSTAKDSDYLVRHSEFRQQLSVGNSQQLFEFAKDGAKKSASNDLLYGIVLHGRDGACAGRLGFAAVRFPMPNLKGYHADKIDLFKMFPDLAKLAAETVAAEDRHAEEDIGDLPEIDLNQEEITG